LQEDKEDSDESVSGSEVVLVVPLEHERRKAPAGLGPDLSGFENGVDHFPDFRIRDRRPVEPVSDVGQGIEIA